MNELKCISCGGPLGEVSGTAMNCPHCGTALLLPKAGVRPPAPSLKLIQGITTATAVVFTVFSALFGVAWIAAIGFMWKASAEVSPEGPGVGILFVAFLLLGLAMAIAIPALMITVAVKARRAARSEGQ